MLYIYGFCNFLVIAEGNEPQMSELPWMFYVNAFFVMSGTISRFPLDIFFVCVVIECYEEYMLVFHCVELK